jgi:hypothetical protein
MKLPQKRQQHPEVIVAIADLLLLRHRAGNEKMKKHHELPENLVVKRQLLTCGIINKVKKSFSIFLFFEEILQIRPYLEEMEESKICEKIALHLLPRDRSRFPLLSDTNHQIDRRKIIIWSLQRATTHLLRRALREMSAVVLITEVIEMNEKNDLLRLPTQDENRQSLVKDLIIIIIIIINNVGAKNRHLLQTVINVLKEDDLQLKEKVMIIIIKTPLLLFQEIQLVNVTTIKIIIINVDPLCEKMESMLLKFKNCRFRKKKNSLSLKSFLLFISLKIITGSVLCSSCFVLFHFQA